MRRIREFLRTWGFALAVATLAALSFAWYQSLSPSWQEDVDHVLWRTTLHVFSGSAVFQVFFWLTWRFHVKVGWVRLHAFGGYVVPCLVASGLIFLREPTDAANVPSRFYKSYIDLVSWLVGTGWGAYASYRTQPWAIVLNTEIADWRRRWRARRSARSARGQ